jgi:FkbM family methyltransferase
LKSNKLFFSLLYLVQKIKNEIHEKYIVFKIYVFNYFKINKLSKKGLYIDCGSNLGQGYDFFSKYFPISKFDHVLVEPNPNCIFELNKKYLNNINEQNSLKIIGKAADIKEGTALFYGLNNEEKGQYSDGASIKEFHNSALYEINKKTALEVETFDFSMFINNSSKNYDLIIVKMDIEGSEYSILKKLLADDNAKYIDLIFVEFHSSYMVKTQKNEFKKLEKHLTKSFRKLGIEFYIWR